MSVQLLQTGNKMAQQHELDEPLTDHTEGQLFLHEAFKIIVDEVLCKGTDVRQKVPEETEIKTLVWVVSTDLLIPVVPRQVCEWREPEELAQLLDLELRESGEPQHQLLDRLRDIAKYSVKTSKATKHSWNCVCVGGGETDSVTDDETSALTGHPRFFNQQYGGMDYHSLAGRFLTEALNTNL